MRVHQPQLRISSVPTATQRGGMCPHKPAPSRTFSITSDPLHGPEPCDKVQLCQHGSLPQLKDEFHSIIYAGIFDGAYLRRDSLVHVVAIWGWQVDYQSSFARLMWFWDDADGLQWTPGTLLGWYGPLTRLTRIQFPGSWILINRHKVFVRMVQVTQQSIVVAYQCETPETSH